MIKVFSPLMWILTVTLRSEAIMWFYGLFQLVLLSVMIVEAGVVMVRQTTHFRVTRALRPLFLLDSYYCHSVRR